MKNLNIKTSMVFTILFFSILSTPMVVMGQNKNRNEGINFNQSGAGIFEGFQGGFGAIFGDNLGSGGNLLGTVFQMLFLQGLNLTAHEMLDNVFVLSANQTRRIRGDVYNFKDEGDDSEIVLAPPGYNKDVESISDTTGTEYGDAYCEIVKNGEITYEIEIGTAVTLVIWDNDKSFITAVNKLINFFKSIMQYQRGGTEIPEKLVEKGISLLTWFLIHINDIFTGDELFVLNPITWQKLDIIPGPGFNITKTWKVTGDDDAINDNDELLEDIPGGPGVLNGWNETANRKKHSRMQWLLVPTQGEVMETVWTQFSFDLVQFWIKNFHIEIDVEELLSVFTEDGDEGSEAAIANAFNGCDIEFYLFTHHLAGVFLYNDTNYDEIISVNYRDIEIDGTTYQRPVSSEVTHRLMLGTVGEFEFQKPTIEGNRSISWGLNIKDVNISAVPVGVDLNSYLGAPQENLEYIYFGFTFEPRIDSDLKALHGMIKLDQFFSPWNDPELYKANSPIPDLDLAIMYVSTVLHFHLNVDTQGEVPDDPEELLEQRHYKNQSHELKIGNYIGRGAQAELDFVDIGGPDYEYGSETNRSTAPAISSIIPLALWEGEVKQQDEFTVRGGDSVGTYSSDIEIQTEVSVMVYAVLFPKFSGTGCGIYADPTFSVFMTKPASQGFLAIVSLIAGICLFGVATVLIKRRKDKRF